MQQNKMMPMLDDCSNDPDKLYDVAEEIIYRSFVKDRTICIVGIITDKVALVVNRMLDVFMMQDDEKPVYIKINSPGGDIMPSLAILSKIEQAKESGLEIVMEAEGLVGSGAFLIYIVGSVRYSLKHSRFMVHQPAMCDMNLNTSERLSRMSQDITDIWLRLREIIKKYTDITDVELDLITSTEFDKYYWPEEAILSGIVDEIV